MIATPISMDAMNQRFFVPGPSIKSFAKNPTTPIGIEPIMISQPSHDSGDRNTGLLPSVPENRIRPFIEEKIPMIPRKRRDNTPNIARKVNEHRGERARVG